MTELITLQCIACGRCFDATPDTPVECRCGRIVRADVRPHVIETGRRIIAEDRELLDRLAAYDAEPSKGADK